MIALVLALALAQFPENSEYGFRSQAGLFGGSGTPDFECGNADDLVDGGWGGQSKYCYLRTDESSGYGGAHGDLTIGSKNLRTAGYLVSVQNNGFGPDNFVFAIRWDGSVWSYGSYEASLNGGGLRNSTSYAAIYAQSSDPAVVPDVVVGPVHPHFGAGWAFGVWTGYLWALSVRDDGALTYFGDTGYLTVKYAATDTGLVLTQQFDDGGTRSATLRWDP